MAIENISRNSGLIKVLAAQASKKNVTPENAQEADQIIRELAEDMNPTNRHMIAQIVAYTIEELQQHALDFINQVADIKNVAYGDKATFSTKLHGIKAFWQAKGSTTARSMISAKKVTLDTDEISVRPAMNIMDIRTGNISFSDLIAEANRQMTLKKLAKVEAVLQAGMDSSTYTTNVTDSAAAIKAAIDPLITKMARLGPVTIMGDMNMVSKLAACTGFNSLAAFSDDIINEQNEYGYIGRYNGCPVVLMPNQYQDGGWTTVLDDKVLYLIPGGTTGDARNVKVVNEGGTSSFESQNIDDMTYEIRIDEWFGCGFFKGADRVNIGGIHLA